MSRSGRARRRFTKAQGSSAAPLRRRSLPRPLPARRRDGEGRLPARERAGDAIHERALTRHESAAGAERAHLPHVRRAAAQGHGQDGRGRAGDLVLAVPVHVFARSRARAPDRPRHQREPRGDRPEAPGPLRRAGRRAAAGARPGRGRARVLRHAPGLSRRGDRDERRRPGDLAGPRRLLGQGAGARRDGVHAPERLHRRRAALGPLLHQRHRQPARLDGRHRAPRVRRDPRAATPG